MKILQLGKFYPIKGGVEKLMYDLTLGLSERGIRCDMMCTASAGYPHIIKLNEYGGLLCCRSLAKLAATTLSVEMITRLRKVCGEYDIIHIHHPDPMAALALRLSGYRGKVILHWHSDILKQKTLLQLYSPLQNWLINRADLILGTTPVYVAQSPFLSKVPSKTSYLPIGVKKITTVHESVNQVKKSFPGKKIVFSLGRLVHYKGFRFLAEAAAHLPDDYMVIIAGEGPLKDELQAYINKMQLTEKVVLRGAISDEERAAWYGACDIYCLSSVQKTEAFAIVQIEAMSCGKPVVATNIPGSGVSWVNKHGFSGLNAAPGNGKALAEAIMEICESPGVHQTYAQNALQRYQSLFTDEKMITDCIHIYERLLAGKSISAAHGS